MTSHCKKNANECLAQKQNDDEWKKILRSEKYECKLLLAVETRNESCFHAFKILLKDLCQKILDPVLKKDTYVIKMGGGNFLFLRMLFFVRKP